MSRPRLTFRQAVQATAMSLVQIRTTWKMWHAGYRDEQARQRRELVADARRDH